MKFSSSSSSLSSLVGGERKSTLCIYTEPEIVVRGKIDMEAATLRQRLEAAEGALKLQTIRCCQLVTEYTGKLQRKDEQLCCEQQLRERQLSYVLQALRLFEERLQREQKNIRQLLIEKDNVISSQKNEILRLKTQSSETNQDDDKLQYCSNCQVMFDAQNSLAENAKLQMEAADVASAVSSGEDCSSKSEGSESMCGTYTKNRTDLSRNVRRSKKYSNSRKQNTDTRRHEAVAPFSSSSDEQDERSGEKDNVNENEDVCFRRQSSFSKWVDSLHGIKRIHEVAPLDVQNVGNNKNSDGIANNADVAEKHTSGDNDDAKPDENWYTSTSDVEDNDLPELYKNNPVLECVNQILLQNSLDVNSSEDSSPKLSSKRVQFAAQDTIMTSVPTVMQVPKGIISNSVKSSDNSPKSPKMVKFNLEVADSDREYESPIECFNYEIQSIYSNDYEPIILSKQQYKSRNTKGKKSNVKTGGSDADSHYYVDMDTSKIGRSCTETPTISKIPPALPPKPPNLISKYKIQKKLETTRTSSDIVEFAQQINEAGEDAPEPDYCSISEINEQVVEKPIAKVKETQKFIKPRIIETQVEVHEVDIPIAKVAPVTRIQTIKPEKLPKLSYSSENCKYISADIPKLPQVSEILIPKEDRFDQDNYIKNNSALIKCSKMNKDESRFQNSSFQISNSVSNILTEINKTQILKRMNKVEPTEKKINDQDNNNEQNDVVLPTFENYDLSQTFEEFKLDEGEINDMEVEEYLIGDNQDFVFHESDENEQPNDNENSNDSATDTIPTYGLSKNTILATEFMRSQLIPENPTETKEVVNGSNRTKTVLQNGDDHDTENDEFKDRINKNYETFLETSGLSSKSIQTLHKVNNLKLRAGGKKMNGVKPGTTVKYWSGPYL